MGEAKVHVLEGSTGGPDSRLVFTCGRRGTYGLSPYVGRARVVSGKDRGLVSCRACRKAYKLDDETTQAKPGESGAPNG